MGRQASAAGDGRAGAYAAVRLPEHAGFTWHVERADAEGRNHGRTRRYQQNSMAGREGQAGSDRQELRRIQAPVGEVWRSGRGEWVQRGPSATRWTAMDQCLGR